MRSYSLILLQPRLFIRAEPFSGVSITDLLRVENICISLSLLKTTHYSGRNFYLNGMESHSYVLKANTIHYGQTRPALEALEDIIYQGIALYKSFGRTYLLATKFVLQAKSQASVHLKLCCCHQTRHSHIASQRVSGRNESTSKR